jgi:hypothetical protein
MTSKNITSQLITHSVFNTNKEVKEIVSDLNTGKYIIEIESDLTSIQLADESIGSETSVGTGQKRRGRELPD